MKKIKEGIEIIEVTDEVYEKYRELNRQDFNNNRKHYRHQVPLSKVVSNGFDAVDTNLTPEEKTIQQDEYNELHKAIKMLTPDQQEIVQMRFFDNMSVGDIADELGICISAVSHRLERIYEKLKTILIKGGFYAI